MARMSREYGKASGAWRLHGNDVELTPRSENGMLAGYLTTLSVYRNWPRYKLVREQDLDNKEGIRFAQFERYSPARR